MTTPRSPRPSQSRWLLGAGLLVLVSAGCSRTSSGANSGDLYVQSCSLACTDGQGGATVSCGIVNVFQNTEVSVLFSEPLDPASIGPASFQVVDVTNGTAPDGQYFIDPLDPRRAIFRPSIIFGGGGVSFSFRANTSYEVLIPGQAQGDNGPYISSIAGNPNQSRVQCTIFTSEGITDPVPGNPRVEIEITRVTSVDGNGDPLTFAQATVSSSTLVTDMWRQSPVVFHFNELMNVATLANNSAFSSPFIRVEFDRDGNLVTTSGGDRRAIQGNYEFEIDNENLLTTLTFTPTELYPSAGTNPSLVVFRVPQQVVDLTNKPVLTSTGGGTLAAIPEVRFFPSIRIPDDDGENFDTPAGQTGSLEDASHGGANWGTAVGADFVLAPGTTGGSGRLGELVIGTGETVVLSTDSQDFPLTNGPVTEQVDVIGNPDGMGEYPFSITVTDGVFEFASLIIQPGGRLILEGSNPARLLVRGPIEVGTGAVLDASGESAGEHDSSLPMSVAAPGSGPGGGDGGLGADRADFSGLQPFINIGAVANPGAVRNGRPGGGVGGGATGGGGGGGAYPSTMPTAVGLTTTATNGNVTYNAAASPEGPLNENCVSLQMGGPGGGGAYSSVGGAAVGTASPDHPIAQFLPTGGASNLVGALGAAGDNTALNIEPSNSTNAGYAVRLLEWEQGNLRGGAGGGGGGNHPYLTLTSANTPSNGGDCFFIVFPLVAGAFTNWHDHSGASGGAGGGGIELVSGKRIDLNGSILARGGQGGSSLTGAMPNNFGQFATPGGGGAGGAVKLRARSVQILPGGTRIDVRGGAGGTAFWALASVNPAISRGGDGSPGLVRIEDGNATASQVTFDAVRSLVEPFDALDPNASLGHLSVAPNYLTSAPTVRPDSISGSSSCWMQPTGGFDSLGLRPDDPMNEDVSSKGWTMNVVFNQGAGVLKRPYRGRNATFQMSWEELYGNNFGTEFGTASPIVVRFQGARTGTALSSTERCNLDPNDFAGPIDAGSLTRWVAHPSELNGILNSQGVPLSPNLIRYVVLFDATNDAGNGDTPGQVLTAEGVIGIDDLVIFADPQ